MKLTLSRADLQVQEYEKLAAKLIEIREVLLEFEDVHAPDNLEDYPVYMKLRKAIME